MSVQQGQVASAAPTIRWFRVFLAGFLAEVALIVVAVPFFALLKDPAPALNLVIPPASFVMLIPFGWWAARGLPRSQVLNGFLAGLAGVVLYLALVIVSAELFRQGNLAASMRPAYLLAHVLKLAGGALGGWLAARKSAAA
jgi:hypothetical protein